MKTLRLEKLMAILKRKGHATVEELSKELGVSSITIRRDLSFLESQGLVERKRGGAVLRSFSHETPFFLKLEKEKEKKIRIGLKALELLEDGQVIFATGGTTVYYTVQSMEKVPIKDITVITNSITTAWAVINTKKPIDLIHTGGSVRVGSFECVGAQVMDFVERLNIDVFLIGVDGIDVERGITFSNYEESVVSRKVLESSKVKIVVADDTKFGKVHPYRVARVEEVDYIVTNGSNVVEEFKESVKGSVNVITVRM